MFQNSDTESNISESVATGRKRRYVISQYPLGTSDVNTNIKAVLSELKMMKQTMDMFNTRMDHLEGKVSCVMDKCVEILDKFLKVEECLTSVSHAKKSTPEEHTPKSVLFNNKLVSKLPQDKSDAHSLINVKIVSDIESKTDMMVPSLTTQNTATMFTESSQIIKLNTEADYPDGCWLGDPQIPEARVRIPLKSYELNNIDNSCASPEKMALLLLDNLFSRDTLADSNLTGKGKHKKKQLDPLLIFGIYCHLQYMFNITEPQWVRIKNNIEAKCRFLWMRKSKGLPLGVPPGLAKVNSQIVNKQPEPEPEPEYTVQLVSDTQYSSSFPIYSCVEDDDTSRVVTVDTESVYQLETGDFVSGHSQDQDILSGTLGVPGVPVLVTSNSNIMLAAANTSNNADEEDLNQ